MTRVERSGNGTWGSTGRNRCQPLTIRHVIVSVGSHGADMINHRGFNRFELTGLRFKTSSREAQPNIPASIQQPSESERNEFMSPSSRLIRINSSFPREKSARNSRILIFRQYLYLFLTRFCWILPWKRINAVIYQVLHRDDNVWSEFTNAFWDVYVNDSMKAFFNAHKNISSCVLIKNRILLL